MPRIVEETLVQVGWVVRTVEVPAQGEDGIPIFNGSGEQKTEPQWILDLIDQGPQERRIIHVPFDKAARDKLVAALTGGIVPASEMPKGPIEL